jgi:AcrR family transcriptional regulator
VNVIHKTTKRDAVTASILDEAARILGEAGPDGLTLHKVADALGYATTAIYRYFESKEAMLVAMQRRALNDFAQDLAILVPRAADLDALTKVAACAYAYASLPRRRPNVFRLIALSLADPLAMIEDDTAVPVGADIATLLRTLDALLDAAAKDGLIGKSKAPRAAILWTQVHGLLIVRKLGRLEGLSALADDALLNDALRTQFVGLGGDKTHVNRALAAAQKLVKEVFP